MFPDFPEYVRMKLSVRNELLAALASDIVTMVTTFVSHTFSHERLLLAQSV